MEESGGNVNGEGMVKKASVSVASAARDVYEQRVKPSPVVERASESYEQFKKAYPAAGETLEHAERAVSNAVASATQRGELLVDDIDKRIHAQYETRLRKPLEAVSATVQSAENTARAEVNREEVKKVRESGAQLWQSVVAVFVMYGVRSITFVDGVVDSKLPSISADPAYGKVDSARPLPRQTLDLLEKIWTRLYTRLAAKANMEPRSLNLKGKNIEDQAMAFFYVGLVLALGMLLYIADYAVHYHGVAGPAVRASGSLMVTAIDSARPYIPGQVTTQENVSKTPTQEPVIGETVGVLPTE